MPIIFVLFVFLFSGCATMESLDQYYQEINWEDGINRNEAALIAKKYLVESKYAGDFQVLAPKAQGFDKFWRVSFLYKSLDSYEKILNVDVDVKTGEVIDASVEEKLKPTSLWEGNY